MKSTKLTIFAGVNGAGKSTLYKMLDGDFGERLNSDEIVLQNGWDWKDENCQLRASKQLLSKQKILLAERLSFNRETTLCGKSILKLIDDAKRLGYFVELYYVGVESVEIAIARVSEREAKGGHGISAELIERRYGDSQENLKAVFSKCDTVHIYDNTNTMEEICVCEDDSLKCKLSSYGWDSGKSIVWIKKLIAEAYGDKEITFA